MTHEFEVGDLFVASCSMGNVEQGETYRVTRIYPVKSPGPCDLMIEPSDQRLPESQQWGWSSANTVPVVSTLTWLTCPECREPMLITEDYLCSRCRS
jgi:hypothetical protein